MNTQTHNPETLRVEVYRLADALLAGEISPAEDRRLRHLVLDNTEARRHYVRFMHDSALLGQWGHGGVECRESNAESESGTRAASGEWRVERETEYPEPPNSRIPKSPNPQIPVINLQIPVSKSPILQIPRFSLPSPLSSLPSAWAFSYSVATVFLTIALLGAWFATITHPDADALANNISRKVTPSEDVANEPSEFVFVGSVGGMVDCKWSDPATETYSGAGVTLGRRYALKSGLMELTYSCGAKVILQGPCDYKVESARGGFLSVGKLVARVGAGDGGRGTGDGKVESGKWRVKSEKQRPKTQDLRPSTSDQWSVASGQKKEERGERREESAANQKSEIRNQKSPSPLSPPPPALFAVRTPTALVEDLGTEFGVEVFDSGETASHVFRGRVVVRVEGAGGGGRGTGSENDKSEIRNHKSEIILSAGQSARVERDAKSGEMKLLSGSELTLSAPDNYVRRLREPPKVLDLLDIVAGGNGTGTRRERGLDPTTGNEDPWFAIGQREDDGEYHRVEWSRWIDGVFVTDGGKSVRLDSAGHVFQGFSPSEKKTWGSIWSRATEINMSRTPQGWVYDIEAVAQFMPRNSGMLCACSNVGLTFDLQAMRTTYSGVRPARLQSIVGLARRARMPSSDDNRVDLWIFVDGQSKFERIGYCRRDGLLTLDVELKASDRFLTLAVSDGGDGPAADWIVFGDPVIQTIPIQEREERLMK